MDSEYRLFVLAFIAVMSFQIAVSISMVLDAHRVSRSKLWRDIAAGSIFCVLMTATQASLLLKLEYIAEIKTLLYASAITYIIMHFIYNITLYYLIKPVLNDKITPVNHISLALSAVITGFAYATSLLIAGAALPPGDFRIIYAFSLFSTGIIAISVVDLVTIYRMHKQSRFISTPYRLGPLAGGVLIVSVIFLLTGILTGTPPGSRGTIYYPLLFYLFSVTFSIALNRRFIVSYPSVFQPKWQYLLPVDIVRVTLSAVLFFTALSLFSSLQNTSYIQRYAEIPKYWIIIVVAVVALFSLTTTYMWAIHNKTGLWYWRELRAGHVLMSAVMMYTLALVLYMWEDIEFPARIFTWLFAELLILFSVFRLIELNRTANMIKAEVKHEFPHLIRYCISMLSLFVIILLGMSQVRHIKLDAFIGATYLPALLLTGSLPLITMVVHTRMRSKADELRFSSPWGILSYFVSFGIFSSAYIIFRSSGEEINVMQLLSFAGYVLALGLELHTLVGSSGYRAPRLRKMEDLLNHHAKYWINPETLEALLGKVTSRLKDELGEAGEVRFDRSSRSFVFDRCDEKTINAISAAMLLEMYSLEDNPKGFSIRRTSIDKIKSEIEDILGLKILTLPDSIKTRLDTEKYYPMLLRHVIEELSRELSPFVPEEESLKIMEKLGKCNMAFGRICTGEMPERMSEEEFCDCLQGYISALEEKFPLEYSLFRTAVVRKTAELLSAYGINVEKALKIAPTGIRQLDNILGGGIPINTSTLLVIENPKARDIFLKSFILNGLNNREHVIFLSTEMQYKSVVSVIISEIGERYVGNLKFIGINNSPGTSQMNVVSKNGWVQVPLSQMMIQHALVRGIKSLPKEEHKRVIIDAMRGLAPYYESDDFYRLLATFIEGHKRWNCTLVVTCYPELGWCTDELRKIFDNVLVLTISGGEARVIVDKFYGGIPEERCLPLKS